MGPWLPSGHNHSTATFECSILELPTDRCTAEHELAWWQVTLPSYTTPLRWWWAVECFSWPEVW